MPKPKPTPRKVNARKLYEKHHRVVVPDSHQVHHILPVRLGGTDEIDNLQALSVEDHAKAHLQLYLEHGDARDLCAYHMILGNDQEALKVSSSRGGRAAAAAFKARGQPQGFQAFDPAYHSKVASAGGKVGGAKQRDLGIGIHAQTPGERLLLASAGGKIGAERNGWKDPAVQSENGKRGGKKNKGFIWVNDGVSSYKLTARQQQVESVAEHLARTGRVLGRAKRPNADCLH